MIGSVISASIHKKLIKLYNLNIEVIAIVSHSIYKYKDELLKYFDKIELIELLEIKLSEKYKLIPKYSKWIKYSITKWQVLQLDMYDKILMCDIDLIPLKKSFYDIFNLNTYGLFIDKKYNIFGKIIKTNDIIDLSNFNNNYDTISSYIKLRANASLTLIIPNKKLFNEYLDFVKICEGNNGYISKYNSGPDETTLLLFLLVYKKIECQYISCNYSMIPWEWKNVNKYKPKSINYACMIKPWIKLPILCFSDEIIWHKIAKNILKQSVILYDIYIKYIIKELYIFANTYNKYINTNKSPYNMECMKQSEKTMHIINFMKNNQIITKKDFAKNAIEINKEILKNMSKKLIVDNTFIIKLFYNDKII
jgi:hypothetical protein